MPPIDLQTRIQHAAQLYESGRAAEAEAACREILKKDARNIPALRILALSCARSMRWNDATQAIEKARKLAPRDPSVLLNASTVMLGLGRFDDALAAVRKARELAPRDPHVAGMFAEALVYANRHDECVAFLRDAAARGPLPDNAILSYVDACIEVGDFDEAIRAARAFLDGPGRSSPPIVTRPVWSSLGRALEKSGRPAEAADAWRAMNAVIDAPFDTAAAEALVDQLIAAYPASVFGDRRATKASESRQPVFILGLARSGTSLLERVVGAHPDAHGIGESTLLDEILETRLGTSGADTVLQLAQRDDDTLERIRTDYLRGIQALAGRRERIANKSLMLPREAGAIGLLFPKATILFTDRRGADTAMSIWANTFDPIRMSWTSRMHWIGVMTALHERLTAHWKRVLPNPMLTVSYESLAKSPADVVPGILEVCGLPMDETCLRPETAARDARGARFIPTLSEQQVRKPINTSAIGRAEAYAELVAQFEAGRTSIAGVD
jgi:tetratricopeptide (TPR) repeat protein